MRVAACDDNPMVRRLVSAVCRIEGFEFAGEADDGRTCVDLVRETNPDVLVLDMDMPYFDGLYAIAELRRTESALRIVVYSGVGSDEMQAPVLGAGADAYVRKGGSIDELRGALHEQAEAMGTPGSRSGVS